MTQERSGMEEGSASTADSLHPSSLADATYPEMISAELSLPSLADATYPEMISAELSLLAFQWRVLALAQDNTVPLLERLRFLGIVTSNVDELYMLHMAELRSAASRDESRLGNGVDGRDGRDGEEHGYSPRALLSAVELEIEALLAAQAACAAECLRAAAQRGVHVLPWHDLQDDERAALRARYLAEIHPDLLPLSITLSPGFPLPHLPHLGLFVGVVYRDAPGARVRLAEHELPVDVPRLMPVPGHDGAVTTIEEVLSAHAHVLHPDGIVEGTYLFRVTRGGDLPLRDDDGHDLLHAVAMATQRRQHNAAVRVEVEPSMPDYVGELIIDNLRREAIGRDMSITVDRVQRVNGLLDLRCLQSLPLPRIPELEFPPLAPRMPIPLDTSMFDAIRERELLMHHPFDSYDETVVRFLREAAADPAVIAISMTLYRVGSIAPIVDALLLAARSGKRVFVLIELTARFDEEHNVQWSRALERAGGRVVHGLSGLKVHAKAALVVRQEAGGTKRYAHVGSGNYSISSGRQYTDFSLFSARPGLAGDVAALFEAFEASPAHVAPPPLLHGAMVAPLQLLPALLQRIDREIRHAHSGRPASIRIKINGLTDREVVRALYGASQAGVRVDLIVRGICTLRPGVPGRSTGIRVVSVVGRFLEHSRMYRFENDGAPEYLIGSSDLRARNLRRRVELLVPVLDADHHARLDTLFDSYLEDVTGWELTAGGEYHAREGVGLATQARCAADAAEPEARR